ncbi:MAG: hypothetical protein ACRDBL_02850 [Rhabdaerophilum sp.]
MSPDPVVSILVSAIDWLMPVTFATIGWVLWRSRVAGPSAVQIAIPLVLALAWGMLWSFVPAFTVLRLKPPPGGQAGAILGLLAFLIGLLFLPIVRQFFRTAKLDRLVLIGPWRIVYGGLLLAIGLNGGLPEAFFWSVALGDIAVGLWACGILLAGRAVSQGHLVAWNIVGLVDLAHALILGALHLRGFFIANPAVPPLNLLPLAGVPVYLVLHLQTLWGLWAQRRAGLNA